MNTEALKEVNSANGEELTKEKDQQKFKDIIERSPGANYEGLVCPDGEKPTEIRGVHLLPMKDPNNHWIILGSCLLRLGFL